MIVAPTTSPTRNLKEIKGSACPYTYVYQAPFPKPFTADAKNINKKTCFQFVAFSTSDWFRSTPNK